MARKRKLDPYTSLFMDRHGKERCRFRRNGYCPSICRTRQPRATERPMTRR
jgi:hypothetical protein